MVYGTVRVYVDFVSSLTEAYCQRSYRRMLDVSNGRRVVDFPCLETDLDGTTAINTIRLLLIIITGRSNRLYRQT